MSATVRYLNSFQISTADALLVTGWSTDQRPRGHPRKAGDGKYAAGRVVVLQSATRISGCAIVVSLVDIVPQTRKVQCRWRTGASWFEPATDCRSVADISQPANLTVEGAPGSALPNSLFSRRGDRDDHCGGGRATGGNRCYRQRALSPDEAIACLTIIGELTFPRGIGPLCSDARLRRRPIWAGLDMTLPRQPSNSSLADTSRAVMHYAQNTPGVFVHRRQGSSGNCASCYKLRHSDRVARNELVRAQLKDWDN
jgi:hypothetical protein